MKTKITIIALASTLAIAGIAAHTTGKCPGREMMQKVHGR